MVRPTPEIRRLAAALLLGSFAPVAGCRPAPGVAQDVNAKARLADEATCATCHPTQAGPYASTAHARTTAWPDRASVKGTFTPGRNTMTTSNPRLSFRMEQTLEGFYQTAIMETPIQTRQRRERIGLVVGSGRKAQTYLYWDQDLLKELPVSYWMETGEWMNSPGYIDGTANFDRGVSSRCLECHATSFENLPPVRHRFRPDSLVPGLLCQKCHGPAGGHVARAQAGQVAPGSRDSSLVNPATLPRERQIDLCALCHAGVGQAHTPPLSYTAGDDLARHLAVAPPVAGQPIDPHGSQVQALQASRCFQQDPTLACSTCHDVHREQRQLESQVASCLSCHQPQACGRFPVLRERILAGCVDCHMPLVTTAKIVMRAEGQKFQPQIRSHRIGIPAPSVPSSDSP